uniref:Photosystem I reaction center subunit VIII n=1 Tax=Discoplastis spathirhyncha TaxID=215771 RepID=A0A3G3LLE5_9EUGL|nr:photosystem I 4 kDa hydrophobic subunit [Discoplastis spathirhyncha]AYQ93527.1 photosystem I 4 kDa hydrophobic subunit [Discoplastis spathirhyncha]
MSASFLPSIFVPFIGLVAPIIFVITFFPYIQKEEIK